ncbi:MAG: hypothetical protein Kow006_23780 [Gammaproteobacteria bacterium]
MADLPELNPLRQVWPVPAGDRSGSKKPTVPERSPERDRKPPRKPPRDDDSQGHIDEYA